jgi:lysophospholipase L1-like esterase
MEKKKTSLIAKIVLVLLGLISGLILAEITLVVGGKIWLLWQRADQRIMVNQDAVKETEKGVYNILCTGDSSTFGLGASSEMNYPSQLLKLLNQYAPGKFRLCLLSTPGINSTQLARKYESFLKTHHADLAIVQGGVNDVHNLKDCAMPLYRKINMPAILANSRLFHLLQFAYADNQSLRLDCFAEPEVSGIGKSIFLDRETLRNLYRQNFIKIVDVSNKNHVSLWFQNYHSKGFMDPTEIIKKVIDSLEVDTIDQKAIFQYADDKKIRVRGKDNWHPNAYGYSLIARQIFNKMVEKKYLQGPKYDLYQELDTIKGYIDKKGAGYESLTIHGDSPFAEKIPFEEEQYLQVLANIGIHLDYSKNIPGLSWESVL